MAVDKRVDSAQLDSDLTDIANAIRAKNGASEQLLFPSEFVSAIEAIPTGGGGSSSKDVIFLDYDGTVVASYSASDFSNLAEMPQNPSHSGLTAQGWNWTLANAKTHVASYGFLEIGQQYVTDDGKTRVYVHFEEGRTNPCLGLAPNGTVTIDWGDGSSTDTLTGTSLSVIQTAQHVFQAGDYVITLTPSNGTTFAILGASSVGSKLLYKANAGSNYDHRPYQSAITKIELGIGVSLADYSFSSCYSLESITIPSSVTSIGAYAFMNCYSLAAVSVPLGVTSIGSYTFQSCYSLKCVSLPSTISLFGSYVFQYDYSFTRLSIPTGVTNITSYLLANCPNLEKVNIPSTATAIGGYAFSGCYGLEEINIPTGVKTIDSNVFQNCYAIKEINIPSSVTSIGAYVLAGCYNLAAVSIPSSVTSIGAYAFQSCCSLVAVDILSSVTSISANIFQSCYSLAAVTIPSSVTSIGGNAFSACCGLGKIKLLPTAPPTLGNNALASTPSDLIIIVPYSADHSVLTAYQTAWSSYASYMVEASA